MLAVQLSQVASGRLGAFFSAAPDAAEVAAGRLLARTSDSADSLVTLDTSEKFGKAELPIRLFTAGSKE